MATITSAQFRNQYASLTEVTEVTVNGHPLGTWTPANMVAAKGPRMMKLPANATPDDFEAVRAQYTATTNSAVPPYDWSDDFAGTPTGLNPSDFVPPRAKLTQNSSSMAPGDDPEPAITLTSPKPRPISVQKVPDTSFGHSRPAPKPGKKR